MVVLPVLPERLSSGGLGSAPPPVSNAMAAAALSAGERGDGFVFSIMSVAVSKGLKSRKQVPMEDRSKASASSSVIGSALHSGIEPAFVSEQAACLMSE
jgi:hypothetical protein